MKFFIISSSVLVFSFSFLFTLSILLLNGGSCLSENFEMVEMKFLQFNSHTNEISRGLVTIQDGNERSKEFGFYKEVDPGKYTLISSFGSEEYQCEGSCWCEKEEDSERRSSSSIFSLRKPIIVLLSALTLGLGINKAKEYFEEKCEEDFSSSCPSDASIRSQVDSCSRIFDDVSPSFMEGTIVEEKNEESATKSSEEQLFEEWVCEGNCLDNKKIVDANGKKAQKEFDCEHLKTKKEFSFDFNEVKRLEKQVSILVEGKFLATELSEFCRKNSVRSYNSVRETKKTTNLCVGTHRDFGKGKNYNIICKRRVSEVRKFICQANCLISGNLKTDKTRQMAEDFGCESLKVEKVVELTVEEVKERLKRMTGLRLDFHYFAQKKFMREHVTNFCKKESKMRYWYESESGKTKAWKTVSLCRARNTKLFPSSDVFNKSVKCLQTYPRHESAECKIMGW